MWTRRLAESYVWGAPPKKASFGVGVGVLPGPRNRTGPAGRPRCDSPARPPRRRQRRRRCHASVVCRYSGPVRTSAHGRRATLPPTPSPHVLLTDGSHKIPGFSAAGRGEARFDAVYASMLDGHRRRASAHAALVHTATDHVGRARASQVAHRGDSLTGSPSRARWSPQAARPWQVWWPFTQHQHVQRVTVVDSAHGDYMTATTVNVTPSAATSSGAASPQLMFDACGSWWTQGLGHGSARLALVRLEVASLRRRGRATHNSRPPVACVVGVGVAGGRVSGGGPCGRTLWPHHVPREYPPAGGGAHRARP